MQAALHGLRHPRPQQRKILRHGKQNTVRQHGPAARQTPFAPFCLPQPVRPKVQAACGGRAQAVLSRKRVQQLPLPRRTERLPTRLMQPLRTPHRLPILRRHFFQQRALFLQQGNTAVQMFRVMRQPRRQIGQPAAAQPVAQKRRIFIAVVVHKYQRVVLCILFDFRARKRQKRPPQHGFFCQRTLFGHGGKRTQTAAA